MKMDEFKLVSGGKRKWKRHKKVKNETLSIVKNEDFDEEKCRLQIENYRKEIADSDFWIGLQDQLKCMEVHAGSNQYFWFDDMVVYGIGSISTSIIARYQLALTLLIQKNIKMTSWIFDPVLSKKELTIIKDFGFEVIEENEECKRKVEVSTLCVMLHCGKAMYNNLLWANWGSVLAKVCILGNAFSSYDERLPSREFSVTAKYIKQILPYTAEMSVRNCFHYEDIFNDTSIHIFPPDKLSLAPLSMWQDNTEPVPTEDDTEIIQKVS